MIYIDASRYSNTGKKTGVENYSYYLINELVRQFGKQITLISPRKISLKVKQIIIPFPRFWTLIRLSLELIKNRKIGNLFVPSHVLPLVCPKKSVITIHDVVFRYSPASYSVFSRLYLDWSTKFAVKHASKIITPSEATKRDLINFYRAEPKKIRVIPLGFTPLEKIERPQLIEKFGLKKEGYFLFIGRIEYKKNTDTLVKAFETFAQENEKIQLVLAGFPGHGGKAIMQSIPPALKKRVVFTGYVSGAEKTALLKNALCFIFPSRFEGFGLPLLEAMTAGVPIIASDIPTSREIAGKDILYFDKENHESLTRLMEKIAGNRILRERMPGAYRKILQRHSWKKCSRKVFSLLTEE